MTQAELAAGDFTKGFISLLETGRTRVSLRAAEILARRLGISAADLVAGGNDSIDLELLVLRSEQQLSAGNATDALVTLEQLSPQASGALRARALRARGRALVDLDRAREGLAHLEEASHAFEALGQRESHIRTMYDRALAYAHLNQPGSTLAVALECDAAMRTGGLIDRTLELQLRSLLATAFIRAGDLDSADLQAQSALRLAEDVVDRQAQATLYSTISLARQRDQDLDAALTYARKSLALFEELGRERFVGQTWHNLASVYVDRGEYDKAGKALDRAERLASEARIPSLQARVLTTRADLAIAQRQWGQALEIGRVGADHAGASAYTRARGLMAQARALTARTAPLPRIRSLFDEAVRAVHEEPPRVRAEIHAAYATALATRKAWRDAYEQAQLALELMQPRSSSQRNVAAKSR